MKHTDIFVYYEHTFASIILEGLYTIMDYHRLGEYENKTRGLNMNVQFCKITENRAVKYVNYL